MSSATQKQMAAAATFTQCTRPLKQRGRRAWATRVTKCAQLAGSACCNPLRIEYAESGEGGECSHSRT
jgi:hypothetical protein